MKGTPRLLSIGQNRFYNAPGSKGTVEEEGEESAILSSNKNQHLLF